MQFNYISLFPEYIQHFFRFGHVQRAVKKGLIDYTIQNIREFGIGAYRQVDDYPYGEKTGMLLRVEPLVQSIEKLKNKGKVIYLSPRGKVFNQRKAKMLAGEETLSFICGHYEGIDQRFINHYVDEELSVGDYVLNGGETAAMLVSEAVMRLLPDYMQNEKSVADESFASNIKGEMLEYDHFTRPDSVQWGEEYLSVPEVLRGGNDKQKEHWRQFSALKASFKRPDILKNLKLDSDDIAELAGFIRKQYQKK